MTSTDLLPMLIILFGAFTQSLTGFGVAMVTMTFLTGMVGIQTAAPLIALVGFTLEGLLLLRYRQALDLRSVWLLILASMAGIPFGLLALKGLDEAIMVKALGLVISGYAVYALAQLKLPALNHPLWAALAGFLSGGLGGAYNTSGPPVIIYGNCKGWGPDEFKANLQGFFLVIDLLVVGGHFVSGNLTATVWRYFLLALPAVALGILGGVSLDRWIQPAMFRQVVLALLMVMGLRMAFF